MTKKKLRIAAAALAGSLVAGGFVSSTVPTASAEECRGQNSRDLESADPMSGSETWNVKIDSCHAAQLVDAYGNAKDAAGLVGLLGAKWWPVGVVGGVYFAWAWFNQSSIKSCAANGTGIQFKEISGIVTGCSAQ